MTQHYDTRGNDMESKHQRMLQLRFDEGEYVLHDPKDGSDSIVRNDAFDPIRTFEEVIVRVKEVYGDCDVRLYG